MPERQNRGVTPKQDAAALRRLFLRRERLMRDLRDTNVSIASHGERLSRAKGYCVRVREEELKRMAWAS